MRSRKGFQRAGAEGLEDFGLSAQRRDQLQQLKIWYRVMGPALANHARFEGVSRGILRVISTHTAWTDTLRSRMPALMAELARELPDLGARRFQIEERPESPGEGR
jgi:predicted nucleic acid-binding Zn ribbon protein